MTTLRVRLGPFPNELDAARSMHRAMPLTTPDDKAYTVCASCYMHDEAWPCVAAQLIAVVDAEIAEEEAALRATAHDTADVDRLINAAHRFAKWTDTMKGEDGGAFVHAMRQADQAQADTFAALRAFGINITDHPPAASHPSKEETEP